MSTSIDIPFTSKNYPIEKKRGVYLQVAGIAQIALGAIELSMLPLMPITFGLFAIALGALSYSIGRNMFKGKK